MVFFESGSAQIQDQYYPVLARVSQALDSVEGQIVVTGYTDDKPIQRSETSHLIGISLRLGQMQ